MDHLKEPLDLEIGDIITGRGEGMRIRGDEEDMVLSAPGMKGKVITGSENLLAHAARKAGLPVTAGPYAVVGFENGFRMVLDSRTRFASVKCDSRHPILQTASDSIEIERPLSVE